MSVSSSSPNASSGTSHNLGSVSSTLTVPPPNLPHYITWRAQVMEYLHGQQLFELVSGTATQPQQNLPDGSPNKEYLTWFQQDQMVLSILLASLSDKIIAQYVRYTNSRAMWLALETSFSQQTHAKLVYLHQQLTTLKKGGESIQEYYKRATVLVDSLAAAGKPIYDDDFVTYILAGLGSDYDTIFTVLSTQRQFLTTEAILSHLLTFEQRQIQQNSVIIPTEISANSVTHSLQESTTFTRGRGGRFQRGTGRGSGWNSGRNFFGRYNHNSYGRHTRGSYRSRGSGRFFRNNGPSQYYSDNMVVCQLCEQVGHTALTCVQNPTHTTINSTASPSYLAHYSDFGCSLDDSLWYQISGLLTT